MNSYLPKGWQTLPLGDVVKPTRSRIKPSDKSHLPFVGMEHIEAHTMKLLGTVSAGTMKSSAVHFQPGDVLYGRLRPYLNKVYRPDFEGLCSSEFIVFPKTDDVDGRYLQYFLNASAFVSYASHLNTGDRPRVDFEQMASYPFPLAPLDQQKRIVAEIEKQFSRLDEAVAALKRIQVNLKRHRASLLKSAVEGRLCSRYRSADGLPKGWRLSSVGELAEVGTGATPKRGRRIYWENGTIPWVTSSAVNETMITQANEFITEKAISETNCTVYPSGTLLLAMYGEGRTRGMCSELAIHAATNQALAAIQAQTDIRPYLKLVLQSAYEDTRRVASGGVQPNLNLSLVRAIPVPLPSLAEQRCIVTEVERRLSLADEVGAQGDAALHRASRLRQSILKRAFSGGLLR